MKRSLNDSINADKALLPYRLFEKIEESKNTRKSEILDLPPKRFEEESFILFASYYILYIMGELAKQESIDLTFDNLSNIWSLYPKAIGIVRGLIDSEKKLLEGHKDTYSHATYFVSNKPKKYFEETLLGNVASNIKKTKKV
jgi:hypothetical protein